MMCNNPNLDLVSINAYTKFGKFLSICSQGLEQKRNYDRQNDGQIDRITDNPNQICKVGIK